MESNDPTFPMRSGFADKLVCHSSIYILESGEGGKPSILAHPTAGNTDVCHVRHNRTIGKGGKGGKPYNTNCTGMVSGLVVRR